MRVYAQPLSRLIYIGKEEVPSSKIVINFPFTYDEHILGESYLPNGLLDPSGQKRRHTSFYFCKRMNKLKLYSLFVWYAQFYFFIRYSHQIEFFMKYPSLCIKNKDDNIHKSEALIRQLDK